MDGGWDTAPRNLRAAPPGEPCSTPLKTVSPLWVPKDRKLRNALDLGSISHSTFWPRLQKYGMRQCIDFKLKLGTHKESGIEVVCPFMKAPGPRKASRFVGALCWDFQVKGQKLLRIHMSCSQCDQ